MLQNFVIPNEKKSFTGSAHEGFSVNERKRRKMFVRLVTEGFTAYNQYC